MANPLSDVAEYPCWTLIWFASARRTGSRSRPEYVTVQFGSGSWNSPFGPNDPSPSPSSAWKSSASPVGERNSVTTSSPGGVAAASRANRSTWRATSPS